MSKEIQTDPSHAAFPKKLVPVESRGGNDMSSGAENWDEIESRLNTPETLKAEMTPEKIRTYHRNPLLRLFYWAKSWLFSILSFSTKSRKSGTTPA